MKLNQERAYCQQQRQQLSPLQRHIQSTRIATTLQGYIKPLSTVLSYWSTTSEVSTRFLNRHLMRKGICVLVPVVRSGHQLTLVPLNYNRGYRNRYGIKEPRFTPARARQLTSVDTIIAPLLGFDAQCHRLGMGGGYYDRLLAGKIRPLAIGLAFRQQQLARLHRQPWDQALQYVITPHRRFKRLRQK